MSAFGPLLQFGKYGWFVGSGCKAEILFQKRCFGRNC